MPLYLVQDPDRPVYVFASSMADAIYKWQKAVAKENGISMDEIGEPAGANLLCEDYEIIIDDYFVSLPSTREI